jgi:hypothetical protein
MIPSEFYCLEYNFDKVDVDKIYGIIVMQLKRSKKQVVIVLLAFVL